MKKVILILISIFALSINPSFANKKISLILQDEYAITEDSNEVLISSGFITCFGVSIKSPDKSRILLAHISLHALHHDTDIGQKIGQYFNRSEQNLISFFGGYPTDKDHSYTFSKMQLENILKEQFPNSMIKYLGSSQEKIANILSRNCKLNKNKLSPGNDTPYLTIMSSPKSATLIGDLREAMTLLDVNLNNLEELLKGKYEHSKNDFTKRSYLKTKVIGEYGLHPAILTNAKDIDLVDKLATKILTEKQFFKKQK